MILNTWWFPRRFFLFTLNPKVKFLIECKAFFPLFLYLFSPPPLFFVTKQGEESIQFLFFSYVEMIDGLWTWWFWEKDCPGAHRNPANPHTKNSERPRTFLLICFESLSLYFFMRNVNHFMKIKWINPTMALKTRLPRFLGLARCLSWLGNNWVLSSCESRASDRPVHASFSASSKGCFVLNGCNDLIAGVGYVQIRQIQLPSLTFSWTAQRV